MNHHYNDITGTLTAQLRQLHRATRNPAQPCFDVIDNEGLCLCVVTPRWWDAHGTPRFCDHHPQHSADIYATEVALLRISCQGCGHEFLVQMTNGLWETAQEMVRQGIADRPARILDRLMAIARDEAHRDACYVDELDNLATEIAALRHPKVPTLADLARDGTIHYGDPPNIGCCPAGPTMNCWDLAVVEFWNHVPLRVADLAKIFDQARDLRSAEREMPRGEAAARYAKEHGVSLFEAGRHFGISRECVRQKWRDLFGGKPTPTLAAREQREQRIVDLAQRGLTPTEIAHELNASLEMVVGTRDRRGLAMVRGADKVAVTAETKAKILEQADAGKSRAEIAHATGVSYGAVTKYLRGRSTRGKNRTRGASALASETMDHTGCSLNEAAAMFVVSPPALYAYRKRRGLWTVAP